MEKVEFGCRRCGKTVTAQEYKYNLFCPTCGTLLQEKPQPRHWLFQFNPSTYKWFERIKDTKDPEQWLVSHHFKLIHRSDLVAIWSAGKSGGICALGKIITEPAREPLNPNQMKYFCDVYDIGKFQENYSTFIEYSNFSLGRPLIEQKECNQEKVLLEMQVFTSPQATNYRLTPEQWTRIIELI